MSHTIQTITKGLAKVEYAAIPQDGTTPQSWTEAGYTLRDSLTMTTDEPELTEIFVEELDDPIDTEGAKGTTTIEWDMPEIGASLMAAFMGGTATAAEGTTPESWAAPDGYVNKELALRLTPKAGFQVVIPRANIFAYLNNGWQKGNPLSMHVKATVLKPTGASTPSMTYIKLAAS